MRTLFVLAFLFPATALAGEIRLYGGSKLLDEDDWTRGTSQQIEAGVESTWTPERWPVSLALDASYSEGKRRWRDESYGDYIHRRNVTTAELAFGPRKVFESGRIRPYVGAGVALVHASIHERLTDVGWNPGDEEVIAKNADMALGYWLGGGATVRAYGPVEVGVMLRYSGARLEYSNVPFEAGGLHVGMSVGFTFGRGAPRLVAPAPPIVTSEAPAAPEAPATPETP